MACPLHPAGDSGGRSHPLRRRKPGNRLRRSSATRCAISGWPSFLVSGKTPAFTGASAGWNPITTRPSSSPGTVSSRYAFTSSASNVRFGTARSLDHERQVPLVRGLVNVLETLARELLMFAEVEIAAVVNAFDLLTAERAAEVELDVERGARVVREFSVAVLVNCSRSSSSPSPAMPFHARGFPLLEPLHVRAGLDEELHLHLLELTRAENEIPRRDLVAERLADLRDAERHFLARGLLHVQEIHVRCPAPFPGADRSPPTCPRPGPCAS